MHRSTRLAGLATASRSSPRRSSPACRFLAKTAGEQGSARPAKSPGASTFRLGAANLSPAFRADGKPPGLEATPSARAIPLARYAGAPSTPVAKSNTMPLTLGYAAARFAALAFGRCCAVVRGDDMRPIWAERRDAAAFQLGTPPRLGQPDREIQGSQQTLRWREGDSNPRSPPRRTGPRRPS